MENVTQAKITNSSTTLCDTLQYYRFTCTQKANDSQLNLQWS